MNVLYFTLEDFESIKTGHSINTDLLREFQRQGHCVYAVSPTERRRGLSARVIRENVKTNVRELLDSSNIHIHYCNNSKQESNQKNDQDSSVFVILKPQIGNIQKTRSFIEKGISTVTIGWLLKRAIKKYFKNIKFDLILYCTPPITFLIAVEYVKKRDGARTYLLLKDIFPQNALDMKMLSTKGVKGFLYRHFRKQEKRLYSISDRIGCMSQANVDYVLKNNPEISKDKVEVCPNCCEVVDKSIDEKTKVAVRKQYELPIDKKIFVYGGNLGKIQGIPFLVDCLRTCKDIKDAYFLIIGDGTERHQLVEYIEQENPKHVKLINMLPKKEYELVAAACDIGLIFLNHDCTIPNFPSRILDYMQAKLPVLACTDPVTDIGKTIVEGGFGWWCESNSPEQFKNLVLQAASINLNGLNSKKEKAFSYLRKNYSSEKAYEIIKRSIVL